MQKSTRRPERPFAYPSGDCMAYCLPWCPCIAMPLARARPAAGVPEEPGRGLRGGQAMAHGWAHLPGRTWAHAMAMTKQSTIGYIQLIN